MKIPFHAWFALCALGLVSQSIGQHAHPNCARKLVAVREVFPISTIGSYDYSPFLDHIELFNLALYVVSNGFKGLFLLLELFEKNSLSAISVIAMRTATFFGQILYKEKLTEYEMLLEQIDTMVNRDHVLRHLEQCTAAFNAFHVYLADIYDCTANEAMVDLLHEQINSLLSKCDVDGSWGVLLKSHANLRDSLRGSLESEGVSCVESTAGLCYEVTPLVSAAAVTSLSVVESVYLSVKHESVQESLLQMHKYLVNFVSQLQNPETVRSWESQMNSRNEVVCQLERRCLEYTTTTQPRTCIEYVWLISQKSYYSWNWGSEKGWLGGTPGACEFEEYNASAARFNLAKIEHLTRSSFHYPSTLSSTLNQDCAGLLWGEICLLESDNTWTRTTCEHIRHNYFCEYTPGCKMDDGKCVSIQPESIENCWLQGLPAGSNNMAGCSLLSSKTTTGCSWRAGWGCRPGLDEGAVVGTQSCAKDYKPCLKDWGSNGTEWSVCANSTECVNVYHGKVIV
uniref:C-type lectin domain-containing protein n=1 Tax=Mucochytrium quahogii TaxID=96639 RepID=A0A7S2WLJ2_9STRA|mmetsp:Transcript_6998/g.12462  ORF Transcript_6998/g.12462 Transcript_6998/m.12462 type:complete len:511 (+) Transcript_6998:293-1825(+)